MEASLARDVPDHERTYCFRGMIEKEGGPLRRHNLLVFSDVHLGSDLVQHARPDAPLRTPASERRDRELVALLDWYRERPRHDRPWRVVIAGDLVDFVGMSVALSPELLLADPTEEEVEHGLGSGAEHTLAKLRCVAEHHAAVFAALARFVADGNTLVIVRGNHDVDFHWELVQLEFRQILVGHGAPAESVEFADWFYYEEGVVWVEHGHQYDGFCSHESVLFPVRPSDPRRSSRSFADVLLRYVVRPTRGMSESGHEDATALDYLRFATRLGGRGLLGLGARFVRAVGTLLQVWRGHMSETALKIRAEHERKMGMLAEARKVSLIKLRALARLQRPPATQSLLRLLAGVMLDRIAFGVVALIGLVWLIAAKWTPTLSIVALSAIALLVPAAWLWRRARGSIDASQMLRDQAPRVAALFPAAFVVMGHTHLPEVRTRDDGEGTYVNLGAWAEDESEDDAAAKPASRTHLVVELCGDVHSAALMQWEPETGPTRFVG